MASPGDPDLWPNFEKRCSKRAVLKVLSFDQQHQRLGTR